MIHEMVVIQKVHKVNVCIELYKNGIMEPHDISEMEYRAMNPHDPDVKEVTIGKRRPDYVRM
jgi:hypothetical protein